MFDTITKNLGIDNEKSVGFIDIDDSNTPC